MTNPDQDPLDGYRGFEPLDDDTRELLAVLAESDSDDLSLLETLDNASEISKFLQSAPGKLLRMDVKQAESKILRYAASDLPVEKIVELATEYRIRSNSLGLLLQVVRDAEEMKQNRENELVQELVSDDYQEDDAASLFNEH